MKTKLFFLLGLWYNISMPTTESDPENKHSVARYESDKRNNCSFLSVEMIKLATKVDLSKEEQDRLNRLERIFSLMACANSAISIFK